MKIQIMTVHDSAAGANLPPIYYQSIGLALRSFKDASNDKEHQFSRHPADYTLFHLGEFDDQTASFELKIPPIPLARAIDLLDAPETVADLFQHAKNPPPPAEKVDSEPKPKT